MKSSSTDYTIGDVPHAQFSTYTSTSTAASEPQFSKPTEVKPGKGTIKSEPPPKEDVPSAIEPPKSTEAAMPGQWEVVEEEDDSDEVKKEELEFDGAQDEHADPSRRPNPKKRERYGEEENALDQMEANSRIMTSVNRTERVPEQYRRDAMPSSSSDEPVFKPKVAKGTNIKKRVKQL